MFDDQSLVSLAGLVPVMRLGEQTGLGELRAQEVAITEPRIRSAAANPGPKLTTLIAGMCAGEDSIDDVDVLRSGGMSRVFHQVYAPSAVGTLLREFTFGHGRQLASVLGAHLSRLCQRVDLRPKAPPGWSPKPSPAPAGHGGAGRSWFGLIPLSVAAWSSRPVGAQVPGSRWC